jgi:hypothetical protein
LPTVAYLQNETTTVFDDSGDPTELALPTIDTVAAHELEVVVAAFRRRWRLMTLHLEPGASEQISLASIIDSFQPYQGSARVLAALSDLGNASLAGRRDHFDAVAGRQSPGHVALNVHQDLSLEAVGSPYRGHHDGCWKGS